ncbi:MAG: signal peptidase I [Planctomycetota bacterium]|jgi:signal peptidase I|nr:signal peptidase I [Planctomycetota bacterium]
MRQFLETARIVVGLILILLLIYAFYWIKPARTARGDRSMMPLIDQDTRAYFKRTVRTADDLASGSVVLFRIMNPDNNQREQRISRVVGLPGDRIRITNGSLLINGQPPEGEADQSGSIPTELPEFTVPREHVFVLFDKRDSDQRKLYQRLVHIGRIIGVKI